MSKGSSGPSQQIVKTENRLPAWVEAAGQKNVNAAFDVAQNLMGPYTGPRVAGLTDGAKASIATLQNNVGAANPQFNVASSALNGLTNFAMPNVNPGSIAQTDLSPYMNPFTDSVIKSGMQAIDVQRQQALNTNADQAVAGKAFGGSRHGVQEGVTNAAASLQAGNLASTLAAQNFQQAQQAAGQDVATNLQGQLANQGAAATGAGIVNSAAQGLAGVAGQQQNTLLQSIMGALQGQQMVQGNQQAKLDADQALYREQQQFPLQQLQIPLMALGMTPYGSTTTQTTTMPQGNSTMSGLGMAMGGLGLLGSLFGGGGAFPMVGANSIFR